MEKLNLIKSEGLNILEKQKKLSKDLMRILPSYSYKVSFLQHLYYKKFIKKALKRLKFYMFYKQLLYINQNKFNYSYLQGLMYLIKKIFNKNVELNLINLKYFYFNSDIFSQPSSFKIKKKKKFIKILKSL